MSKGQQRTKNACPGCGGLKTREAKTCMKCHVTRREAEGWGATDPRERFMRYVQKDAESGCWLWTAWRDPTGYGRFYVNRHRIARLAHRIAYEFFVGPVPDGLELDHLCRVRYCVNPDHLEPVLRRVNWWRGSSQTRENALKTHCLRGHKYTEENTIYRSDTGWRQCRKCTLASQQRRRQKAMAA